jgi:hypothetical protein
MVMHPALTRKKTVRYRLVLPSFSRDSYNGITLAFQANDESSILLSRSSF